MKYLKKKDALNRYLFKKNESDVVSIKYCLQKSHISEEQRLFLTSRLHSIGTKNSITKLRNRCVVGGKARSVSRKFKMSRMPLRKVLALGLVPGFKKAVW